MPCRKWVKCVRIRNQFFQSILCEVNRVCLVEREKVEREFMILTKKRRIFKNNSERVEKMKDDINTLLMNFNHTSNCRLYLGWDYVCETLGKIMNKKTPETVITINDVLAFRCLHCGHGRERGSGDHSMFECRVKCCGSFLNRTNFQFDGGDCSCGIRVMECLGIKPAAQSQQVWRRALYMGNFSRDKVWEVDRVVDPVIRAMGLKRNPMISWFVLSKGGDFLQSFTKWPTHEKEAILWGVARAINEEYGAHRPIQ